MTIRTTNLYGEAPVIFESLQRLKNRIINGNFNVWQRSTSQTNNGYGSDDRWINSHGTSTKTHSRQEFTIGQTEVPNNPKYFSRTVVTSGNTASSFVYKAQKIEDVRTFSGETCTLSFWAKADAPKSVSVELRQVFGSGGSSTVRGIGATKLSLTTAWTKHTVTIDVPSILGKTVGAGNYLMLISWFDAGSDNDIYTDSLGNQSGTFDIAQVQLEAGEYATEFEYRRYTEEVLLCQRYYSVLTASMINHIGAVNGFMSTVISFPVPMRATPSVQVSWTYTSNSKSGGTGVTTSRACMLYAQALAAGNAQATANPATFDAEL